MQALASQLLGDANQTFRTYKTLGEGAMEQASDEELLRTLDGEGNSIALVVKHMAGNMRSRWRGLLTSDGEKPDRDRDSEFVLAEGTTRAEVMAWWEEGWREVFTALEALRPPDLERTITIRGQPLSVLQAILRQLTHYSYHVGQIVFLAKHFRGTEWKSLSIPRKR
jgi:uncharacterized damage-inducible protein DinB